MASASPADGVPLPSRLEPTLARARRRWRLDRAVAAFARDPAAGMADEALLGRLVESWGNPAWSATPDYLRACLDHAWRAEGTILECGSGLTTVLVGIIAERRGLALWSLEHEPFWGDLVRRRLACYRVRSVQLAVAPLRDYGEYAWYDALFASMPGTFALVLCDGPPGSARGGRYGLLPRMGDRLCRGCVILLDDAGRAGEREVLSRWSTSARMQWRAGEHGGDYAVVVLDQRIDVTAGDVERTSAL